MNLKLEWNGRGTRTNLYLANQHLLGSFRSVFTRSLKYLYDVVIVLSQLGIAHHRFRNINSSTAFCGFSLGYTCIYYVSCCFVLTSSINCTVVEILCFALKWSTRCREQCIKIWWNTNQHFLHEDEVRCGYENVIS